MFAPRTLLFYTHALTGGGAERVWALLASGFAQQGHRVIFACDFEACENRDFLDPRVELVILGGRHLGAVRRLAELIRTTRPHATFSAIGVSNLKHALAAAWTGRLAHAVQSYHGYYESEPQLLSRIAYLLTPLTTRLFARSICVSDGLFAYLKAKFHADRRRTVCVYNPVKWGEEAGGDALSRIEAAPPIVLAAGRLVGYKNFSFLLRAFAQVRPADARLVIIGEGPDRPILEADIARLGLGARVTLAGYQKDPWPYYAQARCFASPSVSEAFGLVVVEALAFGLPVVCADCEGPRQILEGGRYGALIPQGDEAAMADAITRALADAGDVGGRQRRARDFAEAIAIARYGAVIDDLLGDARATPTARPHAAS